MTKINNSACEDWIVLDVTLKHILNFLSISVRTNSSVC